MSELILTAYISCFKCAKTWLIHKVGIWKEWTIWGIPINRQWHGKQVYRQMDHLLNSWLYTFTRVNISTWSSWHDAKISNSIHRYKYFVCNKKKTFPEIIYEKKEEKTFCNFWKFREFWFGILSRFFRRNISVVEIEKFVEEFDWNNTELEVRRK